MFYLLLFLWGGGVTPSEATLELTGKDGTRSSLSKIDDIIRFITGNDATQTLKFEKESLMLVSEWDDGTKDNLLTAVLKFNSDGTHESTGINDARDRSGLIYPGSEYYWPSVPVVALPIENKEDGSGAEMKAIVTPHYTLPLALDAAHIVHWTRKNVSLNNNEVSLDDYSYTKSIMGAYSLAAMPVEVKTGLTVKGYDKNLVALLVRENIQDTEDTAARMRVIVDDVLMDKVEWMASPASLRWERDPSPSSVPTIDGYGTTTDWFPASMAIGDFDHDGYKNEIAVAWSDIEHVYLTVLQIADRNNLREIYTETVHTYNYNNHPDGKSVGQKLDGVSAQYCVSVVAGDFNGDDKEEFAVVFKDTEFNYKPQFCDNLSGAMSTYNIHYEGLAGKIHVVTYNWNGSQFLKDEQVKNHSSIKYSYVNSWEDGDYRATTDYIDMFLCNGVKAVTADADGDGKDDIVTVMDFLDIRMMQHDTRGGKDYLHYEHIYFSTYLDVWKYPKDSNTLTPLSSPILVVSNAYDVSGQKRFDFKAENLYSGIYMGPYTATFKRDYLLQLRTRGNNPYPLMEREYDIVGGKFTGRFGYGIVDDFVLKCPDIAGGDTNSDWNSPSNRLYSEVRIVHDIDLDNRTCKATDIDAQSLVANKKNSNYGFAVGNYYGEGLELGTPIHTQDETDMDYIAVLQTVPYHVDNVKPDGSGLDVQPHNFTLMPNMAVTYTNTAKQGSTSNMSYTMTKHTETIFALDSSGLDNTMKNFQGIRGITSAVLGDSTKISEGIEFVGKVWDKLKDTVDETQTKTNSQSTSLTFTTTSQAVRDDAVYYTASERHLWRYPILTYPVPEWLVGQAKDTMGTFDKSQVNKQQSYVTFALCDPGGVTSSAGVNDFHYQPFHEIGNLFSYPSAIELTDGYAGSHYMASDKMPKDSEVLWKNSDISEQLVFTSSSTDQESFKKVNKAGAVTKFFSVIDNVFGTDYAKMPQDDSDSSFSRSVTSEESLTIRLTPVDSGRVFYARMKPYIDVAGTTTVAWAVDNFDRDATLWNRTNSIYSKKPDPSLILPQKFAVSGTTGADCKFSGNDTDATALKMKGVRFYLTDYDMITDNLLMKGLKYTITVPVYNASFVDAENFKVRLSWATSNDYQAAKTTIGEYTFDRLNGWGSGGGNNRKWAEFTWTPDIPEGVYCLFAEIDPDGELKQEIHRNRRDKGRTMIDYGGNNMGYYRIGIAASDSMVFDKSKLENEGEDAPAKNGRGAYLSASDVDSSAFPYVEWVKANGKSLTEFVEQDLASASEPVPVEFEIKYSGEYLMHKVALIGYKLKPEAKGTKASEIKASDIERSFVKEHFALFPGEDHKIFVNIDPSHLDGGIGFSLNVFGIDYLLTDVIYGSDSGIEGVNSSSSGGCDAGLAGLGVLAGLMVLTRKMRL